MSDSLKVVALIPTDPAQAAVVRDCIADMVTATRAEEGCLEYSAAESRTTPGLWIMIENWRSEADLDAHLKTPHIAKAFSVLGGVLTGEVAMHPLLP